MENENSQVPAAPVADATQAAPVENIPQITESEKMVAAIGYVSFLCLLPLILKRDSNFAQFHGKQALLLAIFWFAARYFLMFIPFLSYFQLLEPIVIVYCMYSAYQGNYFKIPILGDEAEKLRF
ncbi:MAG: DUF4870 domain-containing protein [Candidatus Gracilibacteria bacterium]